MMMTSRNINQRERECYSFSTLHSPSLLLRRFVFRMVSHRGERETRVTGEEAQGTTGRVKKGGEAVFSFPPSFACKFSSRERRLGTRETPNRMIIFNLRTKFTLLINFYLDTILNIPKVTNVNDFWEWMNQTLVPGLYSGAWYNGKRGQRGFLDDKMSYVVGVARIRQLRVKSGKFSNVKANQVNKLQLVPFIYT